MTLYGYLTIILLLFYAYIYVWSRPKQAELPPEPPVIDRRWRVFDREQGGYIIFVEAVG